MQTKQLKASLYPRLLREIMDPPRSLYYVYNDDLATESNKNLIERIANDKNLRIICMVGARSYTEYGQLVCEKLIEGLSHYREKIAIVSGLAIGIDSIIHRLCIKHKIPCIAIPGSGLNKDVLYPRTNLQLAESIYENGGVLLSEFEPETKATVWSFPLRNRIMAGISEITIVIEGKKDSGTMITARMALEYNRDVLAVPGSIFSIHSDGTKELIKHGAIPISSAEDITDILGITEYKIKEISKALFDSCTQEEKEILDLLSAPLTTDEICYKTGFSISKILVIISSLEMRGLLEERFGKIYSKLNYQA